MSATIDHGAFPMGVDFLRLQEQISDQCGKATVEFSAHAGKALPATLEQLGSVLSILYRLACCAWGCSKGDHTLEWLAGKLINQASGSYRLFMAGHYDESLVLTRGIGEIANLLCLFKNDPTALVTWENASRQDRLNNFSPAGVRRRIEQLGDVTPVIEKARYQKLCEVGAHPVPGMAPGHYTGTGRPMLNGIMQETGVFVCATELGFAVSVAALWLIEPLKPPPDIRKLLFDKAVSLIRSLGAFTILNYEELNALALKNVSESD
jgi:hypothetical protein